MSEEKRKWWHVALGHTAKVLLTLLRAEKEGRTLTLTDLVRESGIHQSTFYNTVRRSLIEGDLITENTSIRERAVYVKLTEKGRRLAECLESLGIDVG